MEKTITNSARPARVKASAKPAQRPYSPYPSLNARKIPMGVAIPEGLVSLGRIEWVADKER